MYRLSRVSTLFLSVFLVLTALPLVAQVSTPNTPAPTSGTKSGWQRRGVQWLDSKSGARHSALPSGLAAGLASAPTGAHLTYYDGPVISNVHIVQVLYGSGSYDPQIAGTTTPSMGNFYSDITNSGYISLLTQYSTDITSGTNQTIGAGTFDGLYQITPSAANSGTTIDDTQVQAELIAQITAGNLPPPVLDAAGDVNTVYMIYFPPGVTTTDGGTSSCVAGGYCSYHGATANTYNSLNLLYGIFPDMQAGSGCANVCGSAPTAFGNYTSVSYHELSEVITDPLVELAFTLASPLAWYDSVNGEIADICGSQQGSYVANGNTYTIEYLFSDAGNDCELPPPGGPPDFSLSNTPTDLSVTQGSNGTTTVSLTPINEFVGDVSLSASGLPSGVTATFASNPTTSSSLISFAASSTTTPGTSMVTITGVSGILTHSTSLSLTINAAVVQQLLRDPGFEKGFHAVPWVTTPLVINNSKFEPPHSGRWDAWLDGYGRTHTDTITQQVTLPSNVGTATLSFWLHIDTAETTTTSANDVLSVQILNSSGTTVLATLGTFSNLNHASGYQQHSFDMSSFIGQTVKVRFKGTENNSLQTSFVVDDVALDVQ